MAVSLIAVMGGVLAGTLGFTPPGIEERVQAIGSLQALPETTRKAFDPGPDFLPIPAPGGNDWLAQHPEIRQTYDDFVASLPRKVDQTRSRIYLAPLDAVPGIPEALLDQIQGCAATCFGMGVQVRAATSITDRTFTTRINSLTQKEQILSTDVLAHFSTRLPKDAYCLLALTMLDLYPEPSWNFVFGQASLRDRVGVYSFARYDAEFFGKPRPADHDKMFLLRSCKILVHETAHMFGLPHCVYFSCVLNGTNHLRETDALPLHFCPVCLRKLQYCIGFDVKERYEAQLRFYTKVGIEDEANWLAKRLAYISAK